MNRLESAIMARRGSLLAILSWVREALEKRELYEDAQQVSAVMAVVEFRFSGDEQ